MATLLGSPIGALPSVSVTLLYKTEKLKRMGDGLKLLPTQDTHLFLRHCFTLPKLLYILTMLHVLPLHCCRSTTSFPVEPQVLFWWKWHSLGPSHSLCQSGWCWYSKCGAAGTFRFFVFSRCLFWPGFPYCSISVSSFDSTFVDDARQLWSVGHEQHPPEAEFKCRQRIKDALKA